MTSLINYATPGCASSDTRPSTLATTSDAHDPRRRCIVERLRTELPAGVYLSEEVVADLLGVTKKCLQNLRARKPENFCQVHPPYVAWDGRRGVRFPREPLIEFLAAQEYESLVKHVHRCR
ncbi:MAG: hypothetical protein KBC73_13130 [Burkholderiaceae bacterium]|nr:hypothetical protein [Burkholderiaceae bacterium]